MLEIESSLVQESGMPCEDQRNHQWVLGDSTKKDYDQSYNQTEAQTQVILWKPLLCYLRNIYFLIYSEWGKCT